MASQKTKLDDKIKFFHWPQEVEIPKEFHSIDEMGEFTTCCMCEKKVKESGEPYLIERSFKRVNESYENVLFEYAICFDCARKMNEAMSKESMAKLETYFSQYLTGERQRMKLEESQNDSMAWFNHCMVKGTAREDIFEYNICGLFRGDKMLLGEFPYLLSLEAMEEITELLSAETKDELDDFRRNHLGGPPEFEELLKGRPVFIF
ncbi:MAG: hypothetical protein CL840_07075 [Crocinitomicaceae bacterium]|nr:hypothetical protein [Crocinitomicaceae bacterium]